MAKIIAIANQKGGVGKTTTCVNLAASLAAMQKRVLVVDSDPQGNATMASGINKFELLNSICQVLIGDVDIHECLIDKTNGSFHLLPANEELTAAEVRLLDFASREFRLKNALDLVSDNYDYIFIDCPPSLNLLTVNAMCAANSIIVPLQCEYFALEGLTLLIDTVDQLAQAVNPDLKIEGILRTMFDNRNRLSSDVSEELKRNFGDLVYKTIIPRNVRLAEAPSFGKPAMYYDKSSVGAKAYLALAGEIVEKDVLEAKALKAAKAKEARAAREAAKAAAALSEQQAAAHEQAQSEQAQATQSQTEEPQTDLSKTVVPAEQAQPQVEPSQTEAVAQGSVDSAEPVTKHHSAEEIAAEDAKVSEPSFDYASITINTQGSDAQPKMESLVDNVEPEIVLNNGEASVKVESGSESAVETPAETFIETSVETVETVEVAAETPVAEPVAEEQAVSTKSAADNAESEVDQASREAAMKEARQAAAARATAAAELALQHALDTMPADEDVTSVVSTDAPVTPDVTESTPEATSAEEPASNRMNKPEMEQEIDPVNFAGAIPAEAESSETGLNAEQEYQNSSYESWSHQSDMVINSATSNGSENEPVSGYAVDHADLKAEGSDK